MWPGTTAKVPDATFARYVIAQAVKRVIAGLAIDSGFDFAMPDDLREFHFAAR
jgi:hypothetical protein